MGVKQVIVVRKDLNMRKGKMIAQGAHAAVNVVLRINGMAGTEEYRKWFPKFAEWVNSGTKKICVGVNSELELCMAFEQAHSKGIPCSLITDAGHTEFKGEPTKTAVAIGPWDEDEIDKITGELSLL